MTRRRRRSFAAPLAGPQPPREEAEPTAHPVARAATTTTTPAPRPQLSLTAGAALEVSASDDPHEVEAAAVAERMTAGSGPAPPPAGPRSVGVRRSARAGDTPRRTGDPTPAGAGEPLSPAALAWAEPRFGTSFDGVRVHTGGAATRAAGRLSADAFTVGDHITFGAGRLAPETTAGRRLLAHELTHVVQGTRSDQRAVQRQPHHPDAPDHELTQRRAVDDLENQALPAFERAIDAVDEPQVRLAGLSVAALCAAIDGEHRELVPPPAPGEVVPAAPLVGPPAPGPAGARDRAQRERVRAWTLVSQRLTIRQLGGQLVAPLPAGAVAAPAPPVGELASYAVQRKDAVAWVVRDTASLVVLLQRPSLPEADQWTAIGLLRQHLNPWSFGYMRAVVRARGLTSRLDTLASGPRHALQSLTATVTELRLEGIGPADEPGLLELRATEGTIRLLQPLSGAEVARELYGSESAWSDLVVPYNRALQGRDPARWLDRGTVLVVAVDQLVGNYATVFGYARQLRASRERSSSDPYLVARAGDQTLAVGTTVSFAVAWPNSLFATTRLRWWAENDPVAVREHGVPARVDWPDGTLSMVPEETRNASITARALAPGRHVVTCELTMSTGHRQTVERSMTVLTLEEKLAAETRRDLAWSRRPGAMLLGLEQERDRLPAGSPQRRQVETRIAEIRRTLTEADQDQRRYRGHDAHLSGIRGTYVSADEAPMTVALSVFVDSDPGYFDAPDYVLKLWDFTLQGSIRTYRGRAPRPHEALVDVLRTFADDAPYPKGAIRFEITPASLGYTGMRSETLVCRTDGGTQMAAALRALSMVALGVGVASSLALQAEIAVPAFAVAGLLAGAGGAFSLYDRLEHGDFAWDLQTGIDILDIAGAVLTVGVSSAGTRVVGGVGRMSIGGRAQLAVGTVQIGVMSGVHVARISEAIASGDRDRVARALLSALGDGALILIVHRAARRLGTTAGTPREVAPTAVGEPGGTPRRTSSGTVPPDRPPAPPTARPGTPEYRRQIHEQWLESTRRTGLAERAAPRPAAEPLRPRDDIATIEEAHSIYEDVLARDATREVGIFRNNATGAYAVRVGTEMTVSGPLRGNWESVLHYHPNQANVLTHRMPAPADVDGAAIAALRSGRPVTEFIDFPLPGGGRGRSAYRATPRGDVTIEFLRPDGTRVTRSFASVGEYQRAYGARTTYLDPSSPEYRWVVEDLHDYYGGERTTGAGTRTGRGSARPATEPTAREVEAAARRESVEWWRTPGVTTETRFARHEQTFTSIAATLRNTLATLRAQGRGNLLPRVDDAVLTEPVDHFISRDPRLRQQWARMEADARSNPELRRQMNTFLEGSLEGAGSRQVGSRRPDLVEFFLEHGDVVVTDVVYSTDGNYLRVHAFKTDFYRGVISSMIGGRGGPRVSGLDLNLRPALPEARVTP